MPLSLKNMLLLAKVETTSGTDATPTPAANSMLVRGLTPKPVEAEFVERNLIRGSKGNFGQLSVGVHRVLEFETELAGSGVAGTAPAWGPLLKACGFAETIVATTSVAYAPVSSGEPTLTLYSYVDGTLFKMTECKGTVSFDLNAKQIPVAKWRFIGVYSAATDVTFPTTMSFSTWVKPVTVGKINSQFTLLGAAVGMESLTFDIANVLRWRELVNKAGARSPDRKPQGTVVFEMELNAVQNWGEITRQNTEGPLNFVNGTQAGNIITINMPKVTPNAAPTITNSDEIAMVNLGFSINPNVANDEVVITCT